jgi:hypothetical protein
MTTCCEPTDVRGRAGTGSVLSLDAIGAQETFLIGQDSRFNYKQKRHTNFSAYQSSVRIFSDGSTNWPFGRTITVDNQIKPQQMGDLLKNIYLKCRMPALQDFDYFQTGYIDQIGRAILRTVSFTVDSIEIEKIYHDWNVIRDQLYLNIDQKNSIQNLINGGQAEGALNSHGPIDLYIPLNFFFANNDSTYFPLCAIYNQKIKLVFDFHPVPFFTNSRVDDTYQGSAYKCGLEYFDIVFDQIAVTPEERFYIQTNDHKLLIETVKRQPALLIPKGSTSAKNFLVPNIPVETFHWFFRRTAFENELSTDNNIIFNRYNFSNILSTNLTTQSNFPILSDAKFFMNGQSQLGFLEDSKRNRPQTSYYYKYLEPLSANLSSPTRNVYTYSFAIDPAGGPLSGAIDFSKMDANKTFIDTSILASSNDNEDYNMHMFYLGLQTLTFSGGFLLQPS